MICSRRRLTIGESRYKQGTFFSYLFSLVTRKMETYNKYKKAVIDIRFFS
jgi:hypothetical protein